MAYRVVITPEAQAAIDRDIAYIRSHASPEIVDHWYHGLIAAIASLSEMPTRCGLIPEQRFFDDELRQLLYGRRHHKRRIIFFMASETVFAAHYHHGNLPPLKGLKARGSGDQ